MPSIKYALDRMLGVTDEFGVTVTAHDSDEYALVTLKIPAALPEEFRERLQPLAEQRVLYTEADREHRLDVGWAPTPPFVIAVERAVQIARQGVKDAVFAHARGKDWPRL